MPRRLPSILLALALALGTLALTSPPAEAGPRKVAAVKLLKKLRVAQEKNRGTYDRDAFDHWTMRKGECNVRETVLIAESRKKVSKDRWCRVKRGLWVNEYTGRTITKPRGLQIDHRVALAEAWRSGASTWSTNRRRGFANDTSYRHSLLAVSSHSNQSKSDHDPASWLPRHRTCTYVARWVAVKYRWNLTVDRAEHRVLSRRLARCGDARTMVDLPAKGKAESGKKKKKKKKKRTKPGGGVPPVSAYDCPSSHPIKGNANSMIYHLPSGRYYDVTKPEECFATESAAQAAGYRASQA